MPRCPPQKVLLVTLTLFSVALIVSFISSSSNPSIANRIAQIEELNVRTAEQKQRKKEIVHEVGEQEVDDPVSDGVCEYDGSCESGNRVQIRIVLETDHHPPAACVNDIALFHRQHLKKGLNIVLLNSETQAVEETRQFDVSTTDEKLIQWLSSVPDKGIIIAVSFGDVAERLSDDSRRSLERFGIGQLKEWRGGSAYGMLGQRGIAKGKATELIASLSDSRNSRIVNCFAFPLGEITSEENSTLHDINRVDMNKLAEMLPEESKAKSDVILGEEWTNCGMENPCAEDRIPMYFYSGANKDDSPKMCISNHLIFAAGLNDAGRGLNVAVIHPKSKRVIRTGHFDTYEKESTGLELFLDSIAPGELIAVVSFDEASSMLSEMAKEIFYELGSSMIHRLKFRSSWYFIGQKGIRVFTPFEDLIFAQGNNWATPVNTAQCVPSVLSGWMVDKQKRNAPRRHFCAKYDKLDSFCDPSHVDDPIVLRPLTDKSRASDPIFNVPIVVVAGMNTDRLRRTLEALVQLEGLNPQLVLVAHHLEYKVNGDLALLFHFKPLPVNTTSHYNDLMTQSVSAAFTLFGRANGVIVVEAEVEMSPDFLFFFSQLLPVIQQDESIQLIQAFNYNGLLRTSHDPSMVYRVESHSPAYSFLITRSFYQTRLANNASGCCDSLHEWSPCVALVPDVSRVFVHPPDALSLSSEAERRIFPERRIATNSSDIRLTGVSNLTHSSYGHVMSSLASRSVRIPGEKLAQCQPGGYRKILPAVIGQQPDVGKLYSIVYNGESMRNELIDCFGLYRRSHFVSGEYAGYIRFWLDGVEMLLLSR